MYLGGLYTEGSPTYTNRLVYALLIFRRARTDPHGIPCAMSNRQKTRVISARMYTELVERLRAAAAELGVPVSELLVHVAETWLLEARK